MAVEQIAAPVRIFHKFSVINTGFAGNPFPYRMQCTCGETYDVAREAQAESAGHQHLSNAGVKRQGNFRQGWA